ncbi:kidins220 [Symbiodinium natans]|uniref:Kidins220 protein n=1 Tax=Symbiodinium natans TaxID=878477 RepID=A0A812V1R4_9DINO|nr:kidins220 [Symbiodinium natans]
MDPQAAPPPSPRTLEADGEWRGNLGVYRFSWRPQHKATQRLALHANARRRLPMHLGRTGDDERVSVTGESGAGHCAPHSPHRTELPVDHDGNLFCDARGISRNQRKKKHLELELQSLREAYARKIADTELQCEKQIEAAEADRNEWFKRKKVEIAKIRAGVIVMQALFERRKRKFISQMEQEREQTARQRKEMDEKMAAIEKKLADTTEEYESRIAEMQVAHEKKVAEMDKLQRTTEEQALRSERHLKIAEGEITRLQEIEKGLRFEIEDMKVRLQVAERAEDLKRAREKAEFLEDELRRLRKRMADRKHAEAEALRKELMEYVKFIVRILPDEWRARVKPEILQRLAAKVGPEEDSTMEAISARDPSSQHALPPLDDRAMLSRNSS